MSESEKKPASEEKLDQAGRKQRQANFLAGALKS
jgi:hypothetical protein